MSNNKPGEDSSGEDLTLRTSDMKGPGQEKLP